MLQGMISLPTAHDFLVIYLENAKMLRPDVFDDRHRPETMNRMEMFLQLNLLDKIQADPAVLLFRPSLIAASIYQYLYFGVLRGNI